jgi:hypothetical protein
LQALKLQVVTVREYAARKKHRAKVLPPPYAPIKL